MPARFGEKLTYIRRRQGESQVALARALGLASSAYVNNMEAGRRGPTASVVIQLARYYEVSTDYLLLDSVPIDAPEVWRADERHQSGTQLGEKVRFLRRRHRLTQSALAGQLGLRTHAQIAHVEGGRHEPSLDVLLRLAALFRVRTDFFLRSEIPLEQFTDHVVEE